jgi:hypothetical protein
MLDNYEMDKNGVIKQINKKNLFMILTIHQKAMIINLYQLIICLIFA